MTKFEKLLEMQGRILWRLNDPDGFKLGREGLVGYSDLTQSKILDITPVSSFEMSDLADDCSTILWLVSEINADLDEKHLPDAWRQEIIGTSIAFWGGLGIFRQYIVLQNQLTDGIGKQYPILKKVTSKEPLVIKNPLLSKLCGAIIKSPYTSSEGSDFPDVYRPSAAQRMDDIRRMLDAYRQAVVDPNDSSIQGLNVLLSSGLKISMNISP